MSDFLYIDNRYNCSKELGEGAFAAVYKAYDSHCARYVALKVLKREMIHQLPRFRREGYLLAKVDHPNVIKIFDLHIDEQSAYIAMELINGQPLADLIDETPLPVHKALTYAIQLSSAIDNLHEEALIHRDVKPENVMIAGDKAVLMDFNLALSQESTALTATGELVGTPRYLAPEVCLGKPFLENGDIYAFGVLLYEMLVGRDCDFLQTAPFMGIFKDPKPPSYFNPKVPPELDEVVLRCMCISTKDRYSIMEDVNEALLDCASPSRPAQTISKEGKGAAQRKHYIPLLAGLFFISFILICAFAFLQQQGDEVKAKHSFQVCTFDDGFYSQVPAREFDVELYWKLESADKKVVRGNYKALANNYVAEALALPAISAPWQLSTHLASGKLVFQKTLHPPNSKPARLQCLVGSHTVLAKWKLNGSAKIKCSILWQPNGKKETLWTNKTSVLLRAPKGASKLQLTGYIGRRKVFSENILLGITPRLTVADFGILSELTSTVVDGSLLTLLVNPIRLACYSPVPSAKGTSLLPSWTITPSRGQLAQSSPIADFAGGALVLFSENSKLKVARVDIKARAADKSVAFFALGQLKSEWICPLDTNAGFVRMQPRGDGSFFIIRRQDNKTVLSTLSAQGVLTDCATEVSLPSTVLAMTIWEDKFAFLGLEKMKRFLYVYAKKKLLRQELEVVQDSNVSTSLKVLSPKELLVQSGNLLERATLSAGKIQFAPLFPLPDTKPKQLSHPMLTENGKIIFIRVRLGVSDEKSRRERNLTSFSIAGEVQMITYDLEYPLAKPKIKVIGRSMLLNHRGAIVHRQAVTKSLFIQPAFESIYFFSREKGQLLARKRLLLANSAAVVINDTLFMPKNKIGYRALDLFEYYRK